MITDLRFIVLWWLVIYFLGLLVFRFIAKFFAKFFDQGYIFSKTISLVVISYFCLITGIFKLIPFTFSPYLAILLLIIANIFFASRFPLPKFNRTILFEELFFFLSLALWSLVRGFNPDIQNLEKFMDWGFVNSILRSTYFPPTDMWFASQPINYYYFGHLIFAVITKISQINSAITYNLSIATVFALGCLSTFSLVANLIHLSTAKIKPSSFITPAIVALLLLNLGGNLHLVYKISRHLLVDHQPLSLALTDYWYPDATRFIGYDPDTKDKTIHEFPLYSYVVADLHGHLNDIPLVLLFIAVFLVFFVGNSFTWKHSAILGFLLSLCYMTNAWDFAIYGLFFGLSLLIKKVNFIQLLKSGLLVLVFWYLFTLPFSLHFTPMAEGLRLVDSRTPFYQLFVLYGGFWLICFPFIIFTLKKLFTNHRLLITDYFVISLIITATLLVIIPEFIYIKDIYIFEHRRANTMFKLVYQAFILYSLASGYILFRLKKFIFYRLLFALILASHLFYSYYAIKSNYNFQKYRSLYGLDFARTLFPDSYQAILWLNTHVSGQPVILEANGDSYTDFNLISAATGLPTVQGWLVHEWLWRGGYDVPAARADDIKTIFSSPSSEAVSSLLTKYSVKYIFVGVKELEKYPDLTNDRFLNLGAKLIFTSGKTKIWELP